MCHPRTVQTRRPPVLSLLPLPLQATMLLVSALGLDLPLYPHVALHFVSLSVALAWTRWA